MQPPQQTTAANRFATLFNQLNDPVVEFALTDGEPLIVQANEAFKSVFAPESDSLANRPLNDLIVPTDRQTEAKQLDRQTEAGDKNRGVIERTTAAGRRKFLYRGIPAGDDHGFAIYTDVTDKLQRERYLDVLQRVLRHNLRNDLNVIQGQAIHITETATARQAREAAETIIEMVEGLTRLTEEAKTIQRVLDTDAPLQPTDLSSAVETAVADCRGRFASATISCEIAAVSSVRADPKIGLVVEQLLDNAIRHNDSKQPQVHVRLTEWDNSTVELTVADNGPGIPKTEQEIITGEAELTPLKHGSGLGLWLVRWLLDRYGGTLSIETPPDGGTIVSVMFATAQ